MRKILHCVNTLCPGAKEEALKCEPQVDQLLLRSISKLRQEAVAQGYSTIDINDLDFTLSNKGQWSRSFLEKEGYRIGARAWQSVILRKEQGATYPDRKS